MPEPTHSRPESIPNGVVVRNLGIVDYQETFDRMRRFSAVRTPSTPDEFWVLQHYPVYTLGYSCRVTPMVENDIPIVSTDRGGQITYHGPGQIVIYLLLDIRRRKHGIRKLVGHIQSAIVDLLLSYGIHANLDQKAPGVYVDGRKVASLGIRVSRGSSYHGMSLNVNMDTSPFEMIDVCGYQGLEVTTLERLGIRDSTEVIVEKCIVHLMERFGYEYRLD